MVLGSLLCMYGLPIEGTPTHSLTRNKGRSKEDRFKWREFRFKAGVTPDTHLALGASVGDGPKYGT
jgi:hypothetical protein